MFMVNFYVMGVVTRIVLLIHNQKIISISYMKKNIIITDVALQMYTNVYIVMDKWLWGMKVILTNTIYDQNTERKDYTYSCFSCFNNNKTLRKCRCDKGVLQKCFYFDDCYKYTEFCVNCFPNWIENYCEWCK